MKNLTKILILSTIASCACACTTSMSVTNAKNESIPLAKIEKDKIICIIPVADGMFNGRTYTGSGLYVLNSLIVNLQPYASKVLTVDATNYEKDAKQANAAYIVKPIIMHWEPRAAAWSDIPTRVIINISVFDLSQNKEIINANLNVRGRAFTMVSQSAEGLADILIKQFVQNITDYNTVF